MPYNSDYNQNYFYTVLKQNSCTIMSTYKFDFAKRRPSSDFLVADLCLYQPKVESIEKSHGCKYVTWNPRVRM